MWLNEHSFIYSPVTVEENGVQLSASVIVMDVFIWVLQISQYFISRNLSTI